MATRKPIGRRRAEEILRGEIPRDAAARAKQVAKLEAFVEANPEIRKDFQWMQLASNYARRTSMVEMRERII